MLAFGGDRKDSLEMARHRRAMLRERRLERRIAAKSHCLGDEHAVRFRSRQSVGLLVVEILQAVLEVAQKHICRRELLRRRTREQASLRELRQHCEGGLRSQLGLASAADQLENLGDELDLVKAAG